jgi:hypothetical protein
MIDVKTMHISKLLEWYKPCPYHCDCHGRGFVFQVVEHHKESKKRLCQKLYQRIIKTNEGKEIMSYVLSGKVRIDFEKKEA